MTKLTKPNDNLFGSLNRSTKRKSNKECSCSYLIPIDEVPELYHPYSEVSLFLSRRMKQEIQNAPTKTWSIQLEQYLLKKMTPEFQEKFPQFRISVSAIKKTWEKLVLYTKQIQDQPEAITDEGKVNILFLIKQNLKNHLYLKKPHFSVPYYPAYQMASRISECIAAIDGEEPQLEELTKMIWTTQCQLDPHLNYHISPYYEYNQTDEIIVKTILEETAKHPNITHRQLEYNVLMSLRALYTFPLSISEEIIHDYISLLLADKLYPTLSFETFASKEQRVYLENFLRRHSLYKKSKSALCDQLKRIIALYALAAQMPKTLTQLELKEAILAVYPVNKEKKPNLPQVIYTFIMAELALMQNDRLCHSIEHVLLTIWNAYQEAILLPNLTEQKELLEILIWKNLTFDEKLLQKIPACIARKIEEEISNALIDNPKQSFYHLLQITNQFFKKVKELIKNKKWKEIEKKIYPWVIQGDLLCQKIEIGIDPFLLQFIYQKWTQATFETHEQFVNQVYEEYLQKHPKLITCADQLSRRIWILYKYAWYNLFSYSTESCIERFIKWHIIYIKPLSFQELHSQIDKLSQDILPLIPIDAKFCEKLFYKIDKEAKSQTK
ncbi:hypothetical protein [Candidatus Rhabdochlamydia porcellionis]|uniref:Uncharacterized protein n=1 Tax=Candidatus Rhabdochlamydia porcellionis TaxID=225148 RepID=A0ABX8YZV2_9BACT|nr:hypothetical protein [Candidatus Rhabdochlamydia porcellionis]QZA58909.1 hypothetical protein RHAB15C_0000790 [Candidatus Rhabdochlamydia porcellionis]